MEMMRILSLVLLAMACIAAPAFADVNIGVFNAQAVALDSEPAKVAQKNLQSQFGAERSQLEKQAQDLQKQSQSLQAQAAAMSAQARQEKQSEFMRKVREHEEKSRNFARKVQTAEDQIRQAMGRFIFQAASVVAKQKGLNLILDGASGSVIYADKSMDVTKEMLAEVNKQFKAAGSKFDAPAGKR